MGFVVKPFEVTAGGRSGTAYELADEAGTVRAEVWPGWGFNCLRWQVRQPASGWGDILYTSPEWESNPIPTRSGHPVLFPFPGRMRDGRFTFEGREYQLPLTDSSKRHAIHGFTPRVPWDVVEHGGGDESAFVSGRFEVRVGDPSVVWPGTAVVHLRYELLRNTLRVVATVTNPGPIRLPFGLGYHPYFRLPGVTDPDVSQYILQANVRQVYETDADNLPTGSTRKVLSEIDFREPKPIGDAVLDHVLTDVTSAVQADLFYELAVLSHPDSPVRLVMQADADFRELVLFTPPHRQAVAIEPYTCSADAANLAARGLNSGWRVLDPGEEWTAMVEYWWELV